MMRLLIHAVAILILLVLQLSARHAEAHSQSYGYLAIKLEQKSLSGQFEAAVRDLHRIERLDLNEDGQVTWGEIRSRESAITSIALDAIRLSSNGMTCKLLPQAALTDSRGGETYIAFPFSSDCAADGEVELAYSFLEGRDAQHRGLLKVDDGMATRSFVLSPGQTNLVIAARAASVLPEAVSFIGHGFHHILIGYDHILFVLTLLLGTVMQRRLDNAKAIFLSTAKVVTAFTLSHSVTLGLAATGLLTVPVALAESLIAATIALAAINNIWPILTQRVWIVALAFGLIHGVGFANVLADLGLPDENLLLSLLAFNVGVEIGQLVIVAVALPVFMLVLRNGAGRFALPAVNLAISAFGLMWLSDRAFGTSIMPF